NRSFSLHPQLPLRSYSFGSSQLVYSNGSPPPQLYTRSLHDALPILAITASPMPSLIFSRKNERVIHASAVKTKTMKTVFVLTALDRKSTRLNSSHVSISYAVFCLKKKKILISLVGRRMRSKPKRYLK